MRITLRVLCPASCVLMLMLPAFAAEPDRMLDELQQSLHTSAALAGQMNGYDVVFRRDPMQPLLNKEGDLVSSVGSRNGLSVQGIIWSDEHPLVVVDNELFSVGAEVGPYLIAQIQPNGVIVIRGNHELFVPLDRGLDAAPAQEPAAPIEPPAPRPSL